MSADRPTIAVLVYMYDSEGAIPKEVARMQIDCWYWPMIKSELQKIGVTSPAWN